MWQGSCRLLLIFISEWHHWRRFARAQAPYVRVRRSSNTKKQGTSIADTIQRIASSNSTTRRIGMHHGFSDETCMGARENKWDGGPSPKGKLSGETPSFLRRASRMWRDGPFRAAAWTRMRAETLETLWKAQSEDIHGEHDASNSSWLAKRRTRQKEWWVERKAHGLNELNRQNDDVSLSRE